MQKNKRKKQAGFSLIEILIVLLIVSLLGIIGFTAFRSSKNTAQLEMSQRKVAAVIKLAQSYAIQGKTQLIDGQQEVPCGYGFRFTNENEFQIFYNEPTDEKDCQTLNAETNMDNFKFGSLSVEADGFSLENGVALSGDINSSSLYFSTPNANAYGSDGASFSSSKTITLQYRDAQKSITINSTGAIKEN